MTPTQSHSDSYINALVLFGSFESIFLPSYNLYHTHRPIALAQLQSTIVGAHNALPDSYNGFSKRSMGPRQPSTSLQLSKPVTATNSR